MADEKRFSGNVRVRNFRAGDSDGPLLSWQDASSGKLQFSLMQPALKSEEIKILEPSVTFGLAHPEKPLEFFLQPAFENNLSLSVEID